MAIRTVVLSALVVLAACGREEEREEKRRECDAIAETIRETARAQGIPSARACSTSPQDLAAACARLSRCNEELAEL